jgi:hypothetical protein
MAMLNQGPAPRWVNSLTIERICSISRATSGAWVRIEWWTGSGHPALRSLDALRSQLVKMRAPRRILGKRKSKDKSKAHRRW